MEGRGVCASEYTEKLSVFLEILNSLGELSSADELKKAVIAADDAYDAAKASHDAAKKALEDCQGITVVTIWCERGADCQTPPGVVSNPKLHYNSKCPNYIRVGAKLPLLAKACPGTWWSCEGAGQCLKRWDHLSSDEVAESKIVVSDTTSDTTASKLACGVHDVGTAGDHSLQASCSTDDNCISTGFYQCLHTEHEYPKKMACGHAARTPGDHFRLIFSCGHEDYYCYRGDHDGNGCTGYVHPDDRVSPDQKSGETLGACGHMYKPTPATILVHRQMRCPSGPNGEVCSSGTYWVCQSHTHSYVTTDTDTDTDPPKPDPKLTR